jgi:hypothetical protein
MSVLVDSDTLDVPEYISVGPDVRVRFASLTLSGIRQLQNRLNMEVGVSPSVQRQRDCIALGAAGEALRGCPPGTTVGEALDALSDSLRQDGAWRS